MKLASTHSDDDFPPFYKFSDDMKSIIVHPVWIRYFEKHYSIVNDWISWKWLSYMQGKNPNVPAVSKKLFPPETRSGLEKQREYWKNVLDREKIRCIYTNEPLTDFTLDHFIPWSFVVHDQLWNLVPVLEKANSSKSNILPSRKYLEKMAKIQQTGLSVNKRLMEKKDWDNTIEPFLTSLKIDEKDLLNQGKLLPAYERTLIPLMDLAKNQGFDENWTWNPKELPDIQNAVDYKHQRPQEALMAAEPDRDYPKKPK